MYLIVLVVALVSVVLLPVCLILGSLTDRRRLARHWRALQRRSKEAEIQIAMINQGWTVAPASATNKEYLAELDAFLRGEHVNWYPPGYEQPPLISEGKLKPRTGHEKQS